MKKLLCFLMIASLFVEGLAQQINSGDSLLASLKIAREDTNKVHLLLSVSELFENTDREKAKDYINQAIALSRKLDYPQGLLKCYRRYAYIYSYQSRFDSALLYNRMTLDLARQQNDSFNIGAAYFNMGTAYRFLHDLDSALYYSLEAARLLENKGYYHIESVLYDGLQSVYMTLMQYEKAIQYGEKAVSISRNMNDRQNLVAALNNLGLSYLEVNREADAKKAYQEGLETASQIGNRALEAMLLNNLSEIAIREGNYDSILSYANRSIQIASELEDGGTRMYANMALAAYYVYTKAFHQAEKKATEALQIAEKLNLPDGKIGALGLLSKIAFATGQFKKGFNYDLQKSRLETEVFNESVKQREAGWRIRLETENKDTQLKLQAAALQRKSIFNFLLAGAVVTVLLISILSYRTYRQKQKLQQQRIHELETEKKLAATEAVLKGEEQERTRLAKDLHDGLGGMLSGIKHTMNAMKGNLIMTPDNAQAFERSMEMLDSSIQEMRRVAHNLMPEALVKFGLDKALKDFCNDINQSGALKVAYQSIGLQNETIDHTAAINIYRIVQELLHNTLKHATATTAIVQVSKSGNRFSVTVEDDGKGFDTSILTAARGIGWNNIQSRVNLLKGKLDVQSAPGQGTSVHIEFNE
jgi:two-component system NarL family sensor kinase